MEDDAFNASLSTRGAQLNSLCQQLVSASVPPSEILDVLEGRAQRWPTVSPPLEPLKLAAKRLFTELSLDIEKIKQKLADTKCPPPQAAAYVNYLRTLVFAQIKLEVTADPILAAVRDATCCVHAADVASLHSRGYAVIDGVLDRAGIHLPALVAEMATLHSYGVLTPSTSSCNPGAHGATLRCGTADERADLTRQRAPTLRAAVELLRSLPAALLALGYRHELALCVPPTVLVSAYEQGAAYSRHLDCYGDDNARVLTLILYAPSTPDDWSVERDGGCLRLEEPDGSSMHDVAPLGGRLVLFDARRTWHSVLAARRLRFAVTLWVWGRTAADDDEAGPPQTHRGPLPAGGMPAAATAGLNVRDDSGAVDCADHGCQAEERMDEAMALNARLKAMLVEAEASAEAEANAEAEQQARSKASPAAASAAAEAEEATRGAALVGKRVVLTNIGSRPDLNGRTGVCVQWLAGKGRCAVRLDGSDDCQPPLSLKIACVELLVPAPAGPDLSDDCGDGDDGVDDALALNARLREALAELEVDEPRPERSGEPEERMERAKALNARLKAMLVEAEVRALASQTQTHNRESISK